MNEYKKINDLIKNVPFDCLLAISTIIVFLTNLSKVILFRM